MNSVCLVGAGLYHFFTCRAKCVVSMIPDNKIIISIRQKLRLIFYLYKSYPLLPDSILKKVDFPDPCWPRTPTTRNSEFCSFRNWKQVEVIYTRIYLAQKCSNNLACCTSHHSENSFTSFTPLFNCFTSVERRLVEVPVSLGFWIW